MRVFVFRASDIIGEPQETNEASPKWWLIEDIPYGQMWVDDRIWIPHLLEGRHFEGQFIMTPDRHFIEGQVQWEP